MVSNSEDREEDVGWKVAVLKALHRPCGAGIVGHQEKTARPVVGGWKDVTNGAQRGMAASR